MNFEYLRHPLVLSALVLTFLNDHFFKHQFHNFLTGKISDFTGIFYFPLFIYALVVFVKAPNLKHNVISKSGLIAAIFLTDSLFIIFKYTLARIWLTGLFSNYLFKIEIVPDYTDAVALVMNIATYIFASRYFKKSSLLNTKR